MIPLLHMFLDGRRRSAGADPHVKSLCTKVLRIAFTIYFTFAMTATGFQLLLQFNDEKDQITTEIDRIQEVFWEMLAPALWVFDTVQVDATQRGVVKNNSVIGMAIYPAEGLEPTFHGVVRDSGGRTMSYEEGKEPTDVSS